MLNPEEPLTAEHEGQIPYGKLKPIAARILMKKLYGARYARPDLLRAISALARKTTKWRPMQDAQLHRLVCYVNSTLHYRHVGWVGDSREDLVLNLFSDADLASDPEDSVSTTGVYFEVAGPNTCMPLFSLSQKQTAVSYSTPEAEIVAAAKALRAFGVPALELWQLLLGKTPKIVFHEDNESAIRVFTTGRNPTMRHIGRTHRISVSWLAERFAERDIELKQAPAEKRAADLFTQS